LSLTPFPFSYTLPLFSHFSYTFSPFLIHFSSLSHTLPPFSHFLPFPNTFPPFLTPPPFLTLSPFLAILPSLTLFPLFLLSSHSPFSHILLFFWHSSSFLTVFPFFFPSSSFSHTLPLSLTLFLFLIHSSSFSQTLPFKVPPFLSPLIFKHSPPHPRAAACMDPNLYEVQGMQNSCHYSLKYMRNSLTLSTLCLSCPPPPTLFISLCPFYYIPQLDEILGKIKFAKFSRTMPAFCINVPSTEISTVPGIFLYMC